MTIDIIITRRVSGNYVEIRARPSTLVVEFFVTLRRGEVLLHKVPEGGRLIDQHIEEILSELCESDELATRCVYWFLSRHWI